MCFVQYLGTMGHTTAPDVSPFLEEHTASSRAKIRGIDPNSIPSYRVCSMWARSTRSWGWGLVSKKTENGPTCTSEKIGLLEYLAIACPSLSQRYDYGGYRSSKYDKYDRLDKYDKYDRFNKYDTYDKSGKSYFHGDDNVRHGPYDKYDRSSKGPEGLRIHPLGCIREMLPWCGMCPPNGTELPLSLGHGSL